LCKWQKVRKNGWLCEDGRYIAKFNFTICYVYLLYKSVSEYEKIAGDYLSFTSLKDAKKHNGNNV